MTIAVGLLYDGGIALCADTLMSGAMSGHYESKIMGYEFSDGMAVFAFAGYVAFAQSAIQQCADVLSSPEGKRTHAQIAAAVRPVLARAFKEQVVNSGLPAEDPAYKLVAAIWSSVDGLGLYYSELAAFARSANGYQFAGSGSELAELFVRPIYQQSVRMQFVIKEKDILPLAAYSLARVRDFQPHYVGGDHMIFVLNANGKWGFLRRADLEMLAKSAGVFDVGTFSLLRSFLAAEDVEVMAQTLDGIGTLLKHEKEEWLSQQAALIWGEVTHFARKAILPLADKRKQVR